MTPFTNLGTNSVSTLDWLEVSKNLKISELVHSNCSIAEPVFTQVATSTTQTTPAGMEIPVPTTGGFFSDLHKASGSKTATKGASKATNVDLIVDEVHRVVADAGKTPETTPQPTNEAVSNVVSVVSTVKDSLLQGADVDTLHGEINLTWNDSAKQVMLICRTNQEPLVHHHQHIKGKASKHGIEKATAKRLAHWLGWLHE
jgi:hypothetical protein